MKNLLPLFILALIVSCQKADQLTYTEKRVVGSWYYETVKFTPRWSFMKDITNSYDGQVLTFNDDFSFTLQNTISGDIFNGVWQVNLVNNYNSSSNSNQFSDQVIVAYENTNTGETEQLVWDNFYVTKNRLNGDNLDKDGTYQFYLRRY